MFGMSATCGLTLHCWFVDSCPLETRPKLLMFDREVLGVRLNDRLDVTHISQYSGSVRVIRFGNLFPAICRLELGRRPVVRHGYYIRLVKDKRQFVGFQT